LTVIDDTFLRNYYDADGKELSKETTGFINRKVWEYYKTAMNYSRENEVDKNDTVEDFCNSRLENDQEVKDEDMKKALRPRLKMIAEIAACDLDKMSLKYFWMEDDLPVTNILNLLKIREIDHFWTQHTIRLYNTSLILHYLGISLNSTLKYLL
jgi:hypothetical protein